MKKVDVTVSITGHHEGILIHKTLRSIFDGVKYARERGLSVECVISLDNPDDLTVNTINTFVKSDPKLGATVYTHSYGDISKSRNFVIGKSTGTYVAFFDGDDFFTENYLYQAFTFAEQQKEPAIYSPRYLLVFEGDNYLVEKLDCNSYPDVIKNQFETNYFIGQSFVHHKILEKLNFAENGPGFGLEDWHFACEAAGQGFKFYNVPNTIFFYRRKKSGSLLASHLGSSSVIRPTKLFEPQIFSKLETQAQNEDQLIEKNTLFELGPRKFIVKNLQNHELLNHYVSVQIALHKNIVGALKRRHAKPNVKIVESELTTANIPKRFLDIGFDVELMKLWGNMNQYEPLLRASNDVLQNLPIVGYPKDSELSDIYYNLCSKHPDTKISDVVLVPHLTRGGADLAAINLIKELNKNATNKKILVVTTIKAESPWLSEIESLDNVIYIEGKQLLEQIDDDKLILLLLRIIQNWGVERLSIINSEIGYKLVSRYHRAIRDVGCKSYLHTYAFNMTEDGYLYNVISNGLVDAYEGVDVYVTDSLAYKKQLQEINGFAEDKIAELYSIVDTEGAPKKTDYSKKNKILWASRVCDDKLVEVLVETGRLLSEEGISLDIYGSIDKKYEDSNIFKRMIADIENVNYMGSYDGFASLPVNDYDMFLLTSKNEGMPFVILEACAANIFVVAPAVGGIPETINTGINGNLVPEKFNPQSYADAIIDAYSIDAYANKAAIEAENKVVDKRHSRTTYSNSVKKLMSL